MAGEKSKSKSQKTTSTAKGKTAKKPAAKGGASSSAKSASKSKSAASSRSAPKAKTAASSKSAPKSKTASSKAKSPSRAKTGKGAKSGAAKSASKARSTAAKGAGKARSASQGKGTPARRPSPSGAPRTSSSATTGLDKSVENFRESLERSITLSRDRVQEVMDDAVARGRMTRADAERLAIELVDRGRQQRNAMLQELEKLVSQARGEVGGRAKPVQESATQAARVARRQVEGATARAGRGVRDAADPALVQADRLRRRAGVAGSLPITAYDQLTAAQVKARIPDLTPAELRKVRDYEKRNENRKGVISAVEKKLG